MLFYERMDLNHAALRQGLMTRRRITGEESHSNRPQPTYDGPKPTVNVDGTFSALSVRMCVRAYVCFVTCCGLFQSDFIPRLLFYFSFLIAVISDM